MEEINFMVRLKKKEQGEYCYLANCTCCNELGRTTSIEHALLYSREEAIAMANNYDGEIVDAGNQVPS